MFAATGRGTTAKNYSICRRPISARIAEVDTYFDELAKLTTAHLRYQISLE